MTINELIEHLKASAPDLDSEVKVVLFPGGNLDNPVQFDIQGSGYDLEHKRLYISLDNQEAYDGFIH